MTKYRIDGLEGSYESSVSKSHGAGRYTVLVDGKECDVLITRSDSGGIEFMLDNRYYRARYIDGEGSGLEMAVNGIPVVLFANPHLDDIVYKNSGSTGAAGSQTALRTPIPGKIVSIAVEDGAQVGRGDTICTLESMKMQVGVKAHRDGTVGSIRVKVGDTVAKSDIIAEIT